MTQEEIKAMKLVLDELEKIGRWLPTIGQKGLRDYEADAITALEEALAQPEQEPVAHLWECLGRWSAYLVNNGKQADCAPPQWLCDAVKNATTPPRRTWVGLTRKEVHDLYDSDYAVFHQRIEAKLKEKNT